MAGRLSPLGIVTKWLLVPGILAVVGYFIIGPRIGDKVLPGGLKKQLEPVATTGTQTASVTEPVKTFTAPEVDVSVTPAANTQPKKKKRRRKKKKPPVTVTAPETPATTPDTPPDLPPVGNNNG